ncbi:hypothetical protein [Billgrantia saliphila]|uniref:hypothetical protein n=1 Tax=Billgrantia saliphila TaxID=1848458 RepID=UPI000CE57C51|nr:hypothetical protein [Halomonas saliphila]
MKQPNIALTLLPQEQLTLVHSHETGELQRYRRLTLGFLPLMPQVSRLMASLGLQCESRLASLRQVAARMELDACVAESPHELHSYVMEQPHCFVTDEDMAEQVLQQTLHAAMEACGLFQWLIETNATPELHRPFVDFTQQKESEARVLLEFLEQRKHAIPMTEPIAAPRSGAPTPARGVRYPRQLRKVE